MKKIRKMLMVCLAICTFVMFLGAAAAEKSGSCGDGITWTLSDSGVLTISGEGDPGSMPSIYDFSGNPVQTVIVGEGITSLPIDAFRYGYTNLKSVQLPESLRKIGYAAFANCSELKEIEIPDNLTETAIYIVDSGTTVYAKTGSSAAKALSKAEMGFRVRGANFTLRYLFDEGGKETGLSLLKADADAAEVKIPAEVTVIGNGAFSGNSKLKKIDIPKGVKVIGSMAFMDCSALTEVSLPDSLKEIGYRAFDGCGKLSALKLPDGLETVNRESFRNENAMKLYTKIGSVTAKNLGKKSISFRTEGAQYELRYLFSDEKETGLSLVRADAGVEKITVPENVTDIGANAFSECSALTEVILPDNLKSIGYGAFSSCSSLKSVKIPNGLKTIGYNSFASETTLYASIGSDAAKTLSRIVGSFRTEGTNYTLKYLFDEEKVTGLALVRCDADAAAVTIPREITVIGSGAFQENTALTTVVIPEGVTEIQYSAFNGCTGLTSVTLPESLKKIGHSAFYKCESLKQITIPDGLETLETSALGYGAGIRITATIGTTGAKALGKAGLSFRPEGASCDLQHRFTEETEEGLFLMGCDPEITKLRVPEGVTGIRDSALSGNKNLTQVLLPSTLKVIGKYAFYGCSSLTLINIPAGTVQIGDAAFNSCTSLESIALPAGLAAIGENAFAYCAALKNITVSGSGLNPGKGFASLSTDIHFTGDAPAFPEDAFENSRIIAWYPGGNSTWNDVITREYGAKFITWRAEGASDMVPDGERTPSEEMKSASSNNQGSDWEGNWKTSATSYLYKGENDTLYRVEYINKAIVVEQYDANRNVIWKKTIQPELPLWGGFFAGEKYNFIVVGQGNDNQDDSREVLRVIRYSKNWNRIDAAGIYGANTTLPFRAGGLQMEESGNYLFIHTCHQMYTSSDGRRHQANMNFQLYVPSMKFVTANSAVGNPGGDYVSHSFAQFVMIDGDDVVKVDLGDAYPRSVTLLRINGAANSLSYTSVERVSMLDIKGKTGDNYTGVEIGGTAVSATHYLVAGISIDQKSESRTPSNLFVSAVPKNNLKDENVAFRWQTGFTSNVQITAPQLITVNPTRFLMMWTEGSGNSRTLKYVFLNEQGKEVSEVKTVPGLQSGCEPIIQGDQVVWYATTGGGSVFYSISLSENGLKQAGWFSTEAGTGYGKENGKAATGWLKMDNATYYMGKDGIMQTGEQIISGKRYLFGNDGVMFTGWLVEDGKLYCYAEDGHMFCDVTETVGGIEFTFLEDGSVASPIPGDVTGDDLLDGRDVIRLMKWLAEETDEETGERVIISEGNADLNRDGKVDELDLLRLIKWMGGEEEK